MEYFLPSTQWFAPNRHDTLTVGEICRVDILVNGNLYLAKRVIVFGDNVHDENGFRLVTDRRTNETTLYFHTGFDHLGGVITVDVIIRDDLGKAIESFLDIDLVRTEHERQ